MANERWDSPFSFTLAFNLFKKHFEEINAAYWSFVPAYSTIIANAKSALLTDDADPKTFFLIHDEDERRVAPTFLKWKEGFSEFSNYSRLNILMLLSSCLETYLRTVISISFESAPGVIIMCAKSIDGIFLLKNKPGYGDSNHRDYQFSKEIDEICRGDWEKRFSAFQKYFGKLPVKIINKTTNLNDFRIARNNVGHYIGRERKNYSTPLYISPLSVTRISHKKLLEYFKLVYEVAQEIDDYLKNNYIGSYDVIKLYFQLVSQGKISDNQPGKRAREFQRFLGNEGFRCVGNEYYRNIVNYCDLSDANDLCRYSMKACIKEINRGLDGKGTPLTLEGHSIRFGEYHFKLFVRSHNWKGKAEYCERNSSNKEQVEYIYSMKVINEIIDEVSALPDSIIEKLQGSQLP